VVPVIVLVYAFLFSAPGMYPTMPFDSDYRQAFDYYFGGHFSFPKSFHGRKEFVTAILLNPDFNRAYHQFRITIPAYVGVAYSVGACFSVYANRLLRVSNAANEVTP
jgi:hypothetical protein